MKTWCRFGGLVLVCTLVGAVRADESAMKAVIAKAIKATGGEENLSKFSGQTWKEKGIFYGMGAGIPYTGSYAIQLPDKFRMEITGFFLIIVNGDKGWTKMGDELKELEKEQLAEQQEALYSGTVTTLLPLKDKAYTLSELGESKIEDKAVIGIKVSHKGHYDVSLFFDKESGILVKSSGKVKASDQGGKELLLETNYSNYREVEGAKIPGRIVMKRDGKAYVEADNSDLKPGKVDDKLFAKP